MLAAAWVLVIGWQVVEHGRVRQSARAALINRSRDITTTLGLVIRSQRRFGMVSQQRLESALTELVKSGELNSVALLNATGEVVMSVGKPIDIDPHQGTQATERWEGQTVTLVNPIDLGVNLSDRGETNRPTIVVPPEVERERDREREHDRARIRAAAGTNDPSGQGLFTAEADTNRLAQPPPPPPGEPGERGPSERGPSGGRSGRPPPPRIPEEIRARRGLHGLILVMSTDAVRRACTQDLWMRALLACFASMAVGALGLSWRNLVKSSELQMRLLRASELTTHLKEMNLAAAGLAHETRNPLNIIRGLAQLICKQQDASAEIRHKTREIIDETDRVTAQLNEFINYSRPREVRRARVELNVVIGEVSRALTHDLEENCVRLQVQESLPAIDADEQLLRQALFNLLLNAVQAVGRGGQIEVRAWKNSNGSVALEIRDDGPGVAPEHRAEVFKPYFTTHQKGTGLGLAVVEQIVLAHGWEIECLANEPRGAVFRLSHLRPAAKG
jgi:signal transduction histidine kinase